MSRAKKTQTPKLLPSEGPEGDPSLGYLIRQAHRSFLRALGERLARHDITSAQWTTLRALWNKDGCSQVELAERIKVEKASLTPVLDALERKKLIARRNSVSDRRRWNVHLTKAGRNLEKVLLPYAKEINSLAGAGISVVELELFRRVLTRIIGNMS